jgi:uncharacterized membrane protein YqjE
LLMFEALGWLFGGFAIISIPLSILVVIVFHAKYL